MKEKLLRLGSAIDDPFGTVDRALFLYSLVRMQRPKNVVELGTGFGLSSFWMALGAAENCLGQVWSVDDLRLLRDEDLRNRMVRLGEFGFPIGEETDPREYFTSMITMLGFEGRLTQVEQSIDLRQEDHFDLYEFGNAELDLVFSDFAHDPQSVLLLLAHFLPRMSPASSILIDSASTFWPSYLLLEHIVAELTACRVPRALIHWNSKLEEVVHLRRFTLINLTEPGRERQNSIAWIKIEPSDVFPHPLAEMRR